MPQLQVKLLEPQVGRRIDRRKDGKLKGRVSKGEEGENQPKPLEAKDTANSIAKSNPHRIRE
jgi:hypothetical protein